MNTLNITIITIGLMVSLVVGSVLTDNHIDRSTLPEIARISGIRG